MKILGLGLLITSVIGLTACGGSSSSDKKDSDKASATTVNGTASKGIVSGGLVSAYLFASNGVPETTAVDTAVTDEHGDYTLTIAKKHHGKPLYIVVDDNNGAATMKCDIAGGCDNDGDGTPDAAFGADLDLNAGDLSLSAVLPEAEKTLTVNLTPLSTIAAQLAKNVISNGSASKSAIQAAVNNANSQVAERFDLLAEDITSVPVVDLTDAAAVAAIAGNNAEALEFAALNAAIISAVQGDAESATSINEAIQSFAENFVSNGLTDNSFDQTITDLGDILAEVQLVLEDVSSIVRDALGEDAASLDDLADLEGDIETQQDVADEQPPRNGGYQGTPSPTATAEDTAQVKAFVEELRELGTAIDASIVVNGDSADTVQNIINGFDDQIAAADMVSSDDAEAAMMALGRATEAMAEVYWENFIVDGELTTVVPGSYQSQSNDITVVVSVDEDVETLHVEDDIWVNVDGGIAQAITNIDVSAVITELSFEDNTTEIFLDEFTEENVPGEYSIGWRSDDPDVIDDLNDPEDDDIYMVFPHTFNNDGTGTVFSPNGSSEGERFTWSVDSGELRLAIFAENNVGVEPSQINVYTLDGRDVYAGWVETEIDIDADGIIDHESEGSIYRLGETTIESGTLEGIFDMNLMGSVSSSTVELSVDSGSVEANMTATVDESQLWPEEYSNPYRPSIVDFELEDLIFDLEIGLVQKSVEDPISFDGKFDLSISRLDGQSIEYYYFDDNEYYFPEITMGIFDFNLAGTFANTTGESFDMHFGLKLDGTGVPAYDVYIYESYYDGIQIYTWGEETEENYFGGSLNLGFTAELDGISDVVSIELDIERTGFDDLEATLALAYPGRMIEITTSATGLDSDDQAMGTLTLTNNDGVVITVEGDESNDGQDLSVEIRKDTNNDNEIDDDDTLYAWKEVRQGIDFLIYAGSNSGDDIEFETLF